MSAFASLFGANTLKIAVLHDYEGREDPHLSNLVRQKLLPKRGVLHYAMFRGIEGSELPTDVEDVLNPGTYLRSFNEAYAASLAAPLKVSDLPPGDRIVQRIGLYLDTEGIKLRASGGYNHFLPVRAFAANPPTLTEGELDRLQSLFDAVEPSPSRRGGSQSDPLAGVVVEEPSFADVLGEHGRGAVPGLLLDGPVGLAGAGGRRREPRLSECPA